ncbi:hypothetical protein TrST_g1420 [Triparma strigata]|uniref:Uncharacterized protein n=1 Tax=Triparma strigata TaxID=1606541 RepID=A0A9W7C120_9STRA|nr:hypothetical protein TrST_g1420 [Triparma strigata]
MPPKPVDYFAFQTNVFSKYDTRPDKSPDTVYFPEVAPYAPISHLKLPDWGEPYVVVSTGSTELAQTITSALTDSGLQQSSVILDGLVHPAVDLADTELPDTLQVVVRMNSAEFGDELLQYIAESSTEQIALYLNPTIPAQQDFTPLEATPLPKRAIEDDGSFEHYSEKLDALTALIQKKFAGNGFVLSYSGLFDAAMDYGYSETDTDECCLSGYFDNDEYWKPLMHFSTSDSLYRCHGGYANTGDDNKYFLVGEALSTDYSIIGESKNLSSYSSYFCDNSGLQLNYHCASSSCDDESCSVISASMIPAMSGCEAVPADSLPVPLFVKFDCAVDGTPTETLYLDSNCKHQYGDQVNMTQCRESTTYVEGEVWAGGYMRETTVAVFIGVMTNEIGHSSQFGDGFEEVFAAQFGRECLSDDPKYCKIIGEADLASGNLLDFMSRQYLDPTTGLGTDKDYLPGHRVLIFDKAN